MIIAVVVLQAIRLVPNQNKQAHRKVMTVAVLQVAQQAVLVRHRS